MSTRAEILGTRSARSLRQPNGLGHRDTSAECFLRCGNTSFANAYGIPAPIIESEAIESCSNISPWWTVSLLILSTQAIDTCHAGLVVSDADWAVSSVVIAVVRLAVLTNEIRITKDFTCETAFG